MNKILALILLVASVNSHASSNWIYLTSNVHNDDFYIERNSVQKDGDSVTFWVRRNFAERAQNGDLSEKIQRTINCRRREVTLRFIHTYDDIDNAGKQTSNFKPNASWAPIAPDTVMWSIMRFVCK